LAANLRGSAAAEAAADGAVYEAVYKMLAPSDHRWGADGIPKLLRLPRGLAEVRIDNQAGKIPLNTSPVALLQMLGESLGLDTSVATKLAAVIADWRSPATWPLPLGAKAPQYKAAGRPYGPPNAPFRSVDELNLVLGMTPEVFERLRNHVTVYTEAIPVATAPDPFVARAVAALQSSGQPSLSFDEAPTVLITASVRMQDGTRFTRRAIIRITAGSDQIPTDRGVFKVMLWQGGAG
jgi:general secretion pathway protein K